MNTKRKIYILLGLCLLTLSTEAISQDVYNFYFNKNNNGQKTMIQAAPNGAIPGQTPQVTQPTVQPAVQPPMAPTAENKVEVVKTPLRKIQDKFDGWNLILHSSFTNGYNENDQYDYDNNYIEEDASYSNGYGITVNKNLNKYFSSDLGLSYNKVRDVDNESYFSLRAGIIFTPVRLNILVHDLLELGISAGMASFKNYSIQYDENYENGSIINEVDIVRPYYGFNLAINMSNKLALISQAQISNRDGISNNSVQTGLRYKF